MSNKLSVKRNIVSNIILFILNAIIGIWLPPYLIKYLGVGAYGLIPLATTLIGYVTVITVVINGSLSRFLAIDINNQDKVKANRTFNTASTSLGILLVLLVPILIWFSLNIENYISIPAGLERSASVLFLCATVSFVLSAFSSVFNTSGYIANRLDLVNRVSVINLYVRVILVITIFFFISVTLEGYGVSLLFASIASSGYSIYLFKKYTPDISLNVKAFDVSILKDLVSMGAWLMVIQLGNILFLQIDLVVINKYLGAEKAGEYSVLLQWSNMIRMLALMLSGALGPLILNLYAKGETEYMLKLTKISNKLLTLFTTCIVLTLCVLSRYLLDLWIHQGFSEMSVLFIIMLIPLPLNLGVLPLFSLNRAYNRVRIPGLVTLGMGFLNLILAIFFIKYTSLGIYGVAVASGIVLTMKNFIFMPVYVAKTIGVKITTFYSAPLSSLILMVIGLAMGYGYWSYIDITSWVGLLINSALIFIALLSVSYFVLHKDERKVLFETMLTRKNK